MFLFLSYVDCLGLSNPQLDIDAWGLEFLVLRNEIICSPFVPRCRHHVIINS